MGDDAEIPRLTISKISDTTWTLPTRLGGDMPLNNRDVTRVSAGKDFWALAKGSDLGSYLGCRLVAKYTYHHPVLGFSEIPKLYMDPPDDASDNEADANPLSAPHGARNRVPQDADIDPRAGSSDPPNMGVRPDDSDPDLAPWPYRSFPETDTCHSQRVMLGEFLLHMQYLSGPNDPARAARIGKLRASIAAYGKEETAQQRNTQLRTSSRSVRTSTHTPPSATGVHEERPSRSSGSNTSPIRDA